MTVISKEKNPHNNLENNHMHEVDKLFSKQNIHLNNILIFFSQILFGLGPD